MASSSSSSSSDKSSDKSSGKSGSRFKHLRSDLVAGIINGVASVPSGMATAAMAGVNPVFGLYATTVAPAVGSLLAGSQLMQIATNGAAALTAAQAISGFSGDERSQTLFVVVALAGAFLVVFGLLKAGRLLRYVSFPVMTAFLSGVATVLVIDQTAQLTGFESEADTSIGEAVDLVLNLGDISLNSTLVGLVGLALILGLSRTPLNNVGSLVGLVVPTIIVAIWEPGGVRLVSDVSEIPRGLPPLGLPDFSLINADLLFSAFALAIIIAIQGAGISQNYRNPDGSHGDPSRDMLAQGAANIAGGLVSGMPTGGSVGQTALAESTGAKTRLTGIIHGAMMLAIILAVPGLVSMVPMPALAAVMIVAGFSAIRFSAMSFVWRTGGFARWVLLVTYVAALLASIAAAVAIGVAAALVLYVYSAASQVTVRGLEARDDGRIHVVDVPKKLKDRSITVIDAYGSLFFAAARRLREILPDAKGCDRPVVILRLRGNAQVGATLIDVLNEYAHELADAGGRLYLSGMSEEVSEKLERAHRLQLNEQVVIFKSTGILRDSTIAAIDSANAYLRPHRKEGEDALEWPE